MQRGQPPVQYVQAPIDIQRVRAPVENERLPNPKAE